MEEVTTTKKKKARIVACFCFLDQIEPIMKRQRKSHLQMLPEDLLADVLRRLPPRSLAVSRCVCKAWHAIVDVHKLMRADLLPLSFGGIMIGFNMLGRTEFLSYRGPGCCAAVSGNLGYLPRPNIPVDGHCNGLLFFLKPWRTLLHGTGHACPGNHLRACAWVLQRTT
jgi:hypothetical protein